MNELDSKDDDKYNEIFEAVLSAPSSELYSKSVDRTEAKLSKTIKRQHTFDNKNLKLYPKPKKRKETTKDRLIEWNNFYSETKFGIWIQCTKCNKWRRVFQYEEEHEVPKYWHCSMNAPGISGCDVPENAEKAEFSPVDFIPGSIIWAKLEGHPWWPGMVEDDPDTEEYYWVSENGTWYYNVTFLDDKVSRAWVPASFVCSFLKPPRRNGYLKRKYMKDKQAEFIDAAEKKAKTALTMSIKERLKMFSFAHRYEGKWPRAGKLDDDTTTDIMEMIKEVEDIESLKSFDSDATDNSTEQSTINKMKQEFSNHEQLHTQNISKCNENKKKFKFSNENLETEIKQKGTTVLPSIKKISKIQPPKKLSGNTDNKGKVKNRKMELCLEAISFPQKNNYKISIQTNGISNKTNKIPNGFKSTTDKFEKISIKKSKLVSNKSNFQVEADKMGIKKNEDKMIVNSQQNRNLKKNDESDTDLREIENVNKVMKQNTKPSFKPPIKDKEKLKPCNKNSIEHTHTEYLNNVDKRSPDLNLEDKKKNCVHEISTNPMKTNMQLKQDIGKVQNIHVITDHTTPIKTDLKSNNGNKDHVLCPEDKTVNQENLQANSKENKTVKNRNKTKTKVPKIKEKTESKPANKKVKNEEKSENKISKQDIGQVRNIEAINDHSTQIKTDLKSNNENMEHNALSLKDKIVDKENKTAKNSNKSQTNEEAKIQEKIKHKSTNKKVKNEEKAENELTKEDIRQVQNTEAITDHTTLNNTDLKSDSGNIEHNVLCLEDKIVKKENLENKTVQNSNKNKTNEVAKIKKKVKSMPTNKKMKNEEKSENKILNILKKNLMSSEESESILKPVTTSTTCAENKQQIEVISLSDDEEDKNKILRNEEQSFSLSLNFNREQSENEDSDPFEAE